MLAVATQARNVVTLREGLRQCAAEPNLSCMRPTETSVGTSDDVERVVLLLAETIANVRGRSRSAARVLVDDALLSEIDRQLTATARGVVLLRDLIHEANRRNLDWQIDPRK